MNKKHWNTVPFDPSLNDELILKWVDDSYALIVNGLTKKLQKELKEMQ